jgi:hypothetical protein
MPAVATEMFEFSSVTSVWIAGMYENCSNLTQQEAPFKNKIIFARLHFYLLTPWP